MMSIKLIGLSDFKAFALTYCPSSHKGRFLQHRDLALSHLS